MCKFISRSILAVSVFSILTSLSVADTGIFGTYVGVDHGSGNVWYGANQPGPTMMWGFDGADLGDFTVGDNMLLSGAEVLTWKSGSGDVTGASVYYAVYALGASAGSFGGSTINWTANSPFNDAAGNGFSGTDDQKWSNIATSPDVLSGVPVGDYNLAVYFTASTNEGTLYDSNGGNNYVASFSVASASAVPEPAALMLLIAGIVPLALLRRRR